VHDANEQAKLACGTCASCRTVHTNTDPIHDLACELVPEIGFARLAHVLQASLTCLLASLVSDPWRTVPLSISFYSDVQRFIPLKLNKMGRCMRRRSAPLETCPPEIPVRNSCKDWNLCRCRLIYRQCSTPTRVSGEWWNWAKTDVWYTPLGSMDILKL
jgi:hypothetical protein